MTPETSEAKEQDRELTLAWFAGTMGHHSSLEVVIASVGGVVGSDTPGVDLQWKCWRESELQDNVEQQNKKNFR